MYGNETHHFCPNRTIKLSLGFNDRMTFWGLEGEHIPSIIKSEMIPYEEGLFSLSWILPAHSPPASPFMTLDKDGNGTKHYLVLIARSLISSRLLLPSRFILISPKMDSKCTFESLVRCISQNALLNGSVVGRLARH